MSSAPDERPRGRRPDADELSLFHRTLAELCRSDVPLPRAFRVLEADLERGRLRAAVQEMAAEVEGGTPLEEAYGRRRATFPPAYRALVEAGTAAGDLPGVLEEIAAHAERHADTTTRVRRALAWPFLSGVIVFGVGLAGLLVAVPRLWSYAETVSGASPAPIALGALSFLAALLLAVVLLARRRAPTAGAWTFALPVIGKIRADTLRAMVASTLAVLLRRRVPLPAALALASGTAAPERIRERLATSVARAEGGASLADALEASGLYAPSLVWLVRTAEQDSEADRALDDVARICRRRLDRRLEKLTLLVRPAFNLALGAVVLVLAFSFLVPLFEYTSRVLYP